MKLREQMNDLAIRIEMVLASHLERRYHSERSRKRDIIRCIKQETDKLITNNAKERAWQSGVRRVMSNDFADMMSDVEFYEFVTEFVKILKQIGDRNPFRETEASDIFYGETKETDTKQYVMNRDRQTVTVTETDGRTGETQTLYHNVYDPPQTEGLAPLPQEIVDKITEIAAETPQTPQGRVISSGLTPFNFTR